MTPTNKTQISFYHNLNEIRGKFHLYVQNMRNNPQNSHIKSRSYRGEKEMFLVKVRPIQNYKKKLHQKRNDHNLTDVFTSLENFTQLFDKVDV